MNSHSFIAAPVPGKRNYLSRMFTMPADGTNRTRTENMIPNIYWAEQQSSYFFKDTQRALIKRQE